MNDPELLDAIERIIVAGVAMTNEALGRARPNLDLSLQQWRMMVVLGDAPEGHPVGEISRLIAVTLPATGRQLRRLERRGLVTLASDPNDRRVTRARLTEAGLAARESIVDDRRAMIRAALRDIRGRGDLTGLLEPIAVALEAEAGDPETPAPPASADRP